MTSIKNNYQLDHSLDHYIDQLKAHGVQVNNKLQPAFFYLRNGLPYPGLLTLQEVNGHEELVKIPIELILTAHKAMKQEELLQVFCNKFYKEGSMWQDRILVTYLLYLLSISKPCIWTEMAKLFSKDIDIVSFWPEDEFKSFIDSSVLKAARKERVHFQEQWRRFEDIQQQYPILGNSQFFNKQRYKWIYIHTISRCFGSFLNSTYFVPFCELFNHNVVDVSYTCTNEHQPLEFHNGLKASQQIQTTLENKQSGDVSEGSISSGYSEDYVSDDDFDYMNINSYSIKWCSKISFSLNDKENKAIQKLLDNTYAWIDKQIEWKGFTLIYLGQIIEKLKIYENQYKAGRQKFQQTITKIEDTRSELFAYRKHLLQLYRSQGKEYQKIRNERQVYSLHGSTSWAHFEKTKEQGQQVYTHFKMEARDNAKFEPKSQIYFSYGKLSNRTLLIRYGFSLENNVYDHVWLKFKLGKQIEPYPDLFQLIQEKGLSVNYKVKLKSYTMALEPIVYFRMLAWKATHHSLQDIFYITDIQREIQVLERVKDTYLEKISMYKDISQNLQESSMGYHQYFARVYNIEKKKILAKQLQQLDEAKEILVRISLKQLDPKTLVFKEELKRPLKHYLKGLKGIMKI